MQVKAWLQSCLNPTAYRGLVRMAKAILAWRHRDDLNYLAGLFRTDKWGAHWYTQHYQRYFARLKNDRLNVLEIGVGGYQNSNSGGESLRMWKAYFRKSRIVGIDLYDKTGLSEPRIDIRQCDQTDGDALLALNEEYGGFDIIIDDGSHINEHVITTFQILFPLLRRDGFYVVEDAQTAYWPSWGGGIGQPQSAMAFFKGLVDGLNHVEYPIAHYQSNYFDRNIVEIAFFHNLVIIRKGANDEKSNAPALIQRELAVEQHAS